MNATSFRKNIRAEWTPGSRLLVIDFEQRVVDVIVTITFFPGTTAQWNDLPREIIGVYFALFIQAIPV